MDGLAVGQAKVQPDFPDFQKGKATDGRRRQ
jgi:hypothetical protein